MKIRELIEELSKLDPDMTVVYPGREGWDEVVGVDADPARDGYFDVKGNVLGVGTVVAHLRDWPRYDNRIGGTKREDAMAETAEEQRTRILKAHPDIEPADYDLAVELGYQPESWDGMWRLPMNPFTFHNGHVIIREVATHRGRAKWRGNRVIYRVRTHKA